MRKAATLYDYIKWRGDLTFRQDEFNERDAAVLSQLVYTDFSKFSSLNEDRDYITFKDIGEKIKSHTEFLIVNGDYIQRKEEYDEFLLAACDTDRYGNIKIRKYVDITVLEQNIQFAAATFELDNGLKVITFRGTDDSVVGWKEDFMLSYETTGSQLAAGEYINARLKDEIDGEFYICGHSKGANLAVFAAAVLKDEEIKRLKHIYMFDGPGICEPVLNEAQILEANDILKDKEDPEEKIKEIYSRLDDKTTRISPESCFIGKIFEAKFTDTRLVKSTAKGLGQHSLVTWCMDYHDFLYAEKFERGSVWAGKIFDEWMKYQDMEKRKIFVEEIFGAFEEAGIERFSDILKHGFSSIKKIAGAASGISGTTKKMAMDLPKTGINDIGKSNKKKIDKLQEKVEGKISHLPELSIKSKNYITLSDK